MAHLLPYVQVGDELVPIDLNGVLIDSAELADVGAAVTQVDVTTDEYETEPGHEVTGTVRLRDTGDGLLRARRVREWLDDTGAVIETVTGAWVDEGAAEPPPAPVEETLTIRYSSSSDLSNSQPLAGALVGGSQHVFLHGSDSGSALPAGWSVQWRINGVDDLADTTSPYQLNRGPAEDLSALPAGQNTISAVVDDGSGTETVSATFTSIRALLYSTTFPTSIADNDGLLHGQTTEGDIWVLFDPDGITATISDVELRGFNNGLLYWREFTAPYGDTSSSLNLSDGTYTFFPRIRFSDGTTVDGPPSTVTVENSTAPPPGGSTDPDLANGFTRAAFLADRVGFGRLAGGTGDGSDDDALTWTEVTVTSLSESALVNAIGERRWITFTPGLSGTIDVAGVEPNHGRFVIDGRGANITIRPNGNDAFIWENISNVLVGWINGKVASSTRDVFRVTRGASRLYFRHLFFDGTGSTGDGAIDMTRGATDITLDYIHYDRWTKTGLAGGDDPVNDTEAAKGGMRIFARYCWFDNCVDRQYRMRFSYVHYVNCQWEDFNYAIVASQESQALAEGCIVIGGNRSYMIPGPISDDNKPGECRSEGEWLVPNTGAKSVQERNPGNVANPSYAYTVDVADATLRTFIEANAGNV